ncbi:MAG TPA: single-stranded-DNA-specific exonuclease RecJ [Burkholderiales bacterium]|nr:single-stranded-DNA-specific exonuclease RecJ [Burkholderiales bacterium]
MSEPRIVERAVPRSAYRALLDGSIHPVLARVFAARGIDDPARLDTGLAGLLPYASLARSEEAARLLADAISRREQLMIVADYDADGATACALGVSVLRALGARVEYLVPNRFDYGYGLTPEIVALAAKRSPRWLITVDNGIASIEGVDAANALGIGVLVTDHHLPGARLPQAACIVNPNQPGCGFRSKHLAGVGVMFYLLLALRAELRARGAFRDRPEPNLADYLDLVALGTVADVARLDDNNRILVAQGLRRIRAGRARPGVEALFGVAGRDSRRASGYDLAFVLGPRLNAAGRLTDMALGIECLLASDAGRAAELAGELDALNRERRDLEAQMQDSALAIVDRIDPADRYSLSLYDETWHQGVIGILASRLRERFHRPVFAFAPGGGEEARGSGRSIPALHLRDALDLVSKRRPGLLLRFGGHAAAAGVTIRRDQVHAFADAFETVVRDLVGPPDLEQVVEIDGALGPDGPSIELAETIDAQVWGQGFPPPVFCEEFSVTEQRVVGGRHLKLRLRPAGGSRSVEAMRFGEEDPLPELVRAVYRVQLNEYNGARTPQLVIERWTPA